MRYRHRERLERNAPYILIANHSSWIDPVVMAYPIKRYEVTFLGKKELVKNKLAARILNQLHMIVVDRHNMDMEAMRSCMRVVKGNGILGIFPEGTRHHRGVMEETEAGVGLIALRSNVPLIPMYIDRAVCPFRVTHVTVGEPVPYDDLRAQGVNMETSRALMDRLREVYRELIRDGQ